MRTDAPAVALTFWQSTNKFFAALTKLNVVNVKLCLRHAASLRTIAEVTINKFHTRQKSLALDCP